MKSVCLVTASVVGLVAVGATSCIIKGSTERPCTSSSYDFNISIESFASVQAWSPFENLPELESRTISMKSVTLKKFRSDAPSGFSITIR